MVFNHTGVILEAVIKTVDNITVLNNLLIMTCACDNFEAVNVCISEVADDFSTSIKVSLIQRNPDLVEHLY